MNWTNFPHSVHKTSESGRADTIFHKLSSFWFHIWLEPRVKIFKYTTFLLPGGQPAHKTLITWFSKNNQLPLSHKHAQRYLVIEIIQAAFSCDIFIIVSWIISLCPRPEPSKFHFQTNMYCCYKKPSRKAGFCAIKCHRKIKTPMPSLKDSWTKSKSWARRLTRIRRLLVRKENGKEVLLFKFQSSAE